MYNSVKMAKASPLVLRANHFQFGAAERLAFGPVASCMQLWCRAGRGRVSVNGRAFELGPGDALLLPWRHQIAYQADRLKPFLVSGIHVVPAAEHGMREIPFGDVPHDGGSLPGMTEGRHPLGAEPRFVKLEARPGLRELGEYVVAAFLRTPLDESEQRLHARMLIKEWALAVAREPKPSLTTSSELRLLERYVRGHLSERLSVPTLARVMGVSPSSIHRLVTENLRTTPARWVRSLRIEEAQHRLPLARRALAELARDLGFCDEFHFSRVFKQETGESPSAWQKKRSLM
jgi:AraC-like DNA-binding protein